MALDSGAGGITSPPQNGLKEDYQDTVCKLRSLLRHVELDSVFLVFASRSFQVKRIERNLLKE